VSQNCEQDGVFEDVGVVSGVEGVAITEHPWMVTASDSLAPFVGSGPNQHHTCKLAENAELAVSL
jgi:hypothetical protein